MIALVNVDVDVVVDEQIPAPLRKKVKHADRVFTVSPYNLFHNVLLG